MGKESELPKILAQTPKNKDEAKKQLVIAVACMKELYNSLSDKYKEKFKAFLDGKQ